MKTKYLILPVLVLTIPAMLAFKAAQKLATQHSTAVEAAAPSNRHVLQVRNPQDLKAFFRYTPDRLPFVSAHRGGPRKGFPENCIATFENTLAHTPAILEVDPRFTRDGQIVLMHDATLDRTTNGQGKVSDHTLQQIKALRLKDTDGNLTDYQVPTLDEALQWAKGKTILVIDQKDVPIEARVKKIQENKAGAHAIVISYSLEDTRKCYQLDKDIVMEVMMGKMDQVQAMDQSGVPWGNVVGFVSHDLDPDKAILQQVHKRGAMVILGSSRNYDRQYTSGQINAQELAAGYRRLARYGADIIEADLSLEAGQALKPLQAARSSKARFFKH